MIVKFIGYKEVLIVDFRKNIATMNMQGKCGRTILQSTMHSIQLGTTKKTSMIINDLIHEGFIVRDTDGEGRILRMSPSGKKDLMR